MKRCDGETKHKLSWKVWWVGMAGLGLLVWVSALGLVYCNHLNRHYFAELQGLNNQREAFQEEWGQLLLEQSTLTSHVRIEQLARKKLQMVFPSEQKIVQVPTRER